MKNYTLEQKMKITLVNNHFKVSKWNLNQIINQLNPQKVSNFLTTNLLMIVILTHQII